MDTKPQKPIKLFNYRVGYVMANGDHQEFVATAGAQETAVFQALKTLAAAIPPSSAASEVHISIGNKKDTA